MLIIGVICISKAAADCADCTNYGNCIDTTENATCAQCVCPDGFSGDCCEVDAPSVCSSSPCSTDTSQHYNCVDYDHGLYGCVCQSGWTGTNCDTAINGCNPNLCVNSNSCSKGSGSSFTCNCKSGYYGTYCQSEFHQSYYFLILVFQLTVIAATTVVSVAVLLVHARTELHAWKRTVTISTPADVQQAIQEPTAIVCFYSQ